MVAVSRCRYGGVRTPTIGALATLVALTIAAGAAGGTITLRDAGTHFSVSAPTGASLHFSKGVYRISLAGTTIGFSQTKTTVSSTAYGSALLSALGGTTVSRKATASRFAATVKAGGHTESVLVLDRGVRLMVVTGSAAGAGVPVSELDRVAGSAHGGVTITAPAGSNRAELPLRRYVNPDGSASALVPAGSDWTIDGSNGLIEGSSPSKGSFVFGLFLSVVLPQNAPANAPPSTLISPYLNAANALLTILPRLVPITDLRVERVLRDGVLPTYTSSGMVLIHFKTGGKPWVGVVTLGTDSPEKYGNFSWGFYYSGISVPESSDGSVGQALLRAWHSWDPGAAIAARTRASLALVNETNEMWQQVSQFSVETQDRQARDVGCLLLGYYAIEDNSRAYNLPSAPCGYAYTPANG